MMDLLEVTLTLAAPEMAPLTTTMAALLDPTAAVNWAKVETVVVVPPFPPVVLQTHRQSDCKMKAIRMPKSYAYPPFCVA